MFVSGLVPSGEMFKARVKLFSVNLILIGTEGKDHRSSKSLRRTRWQSARRQYVQDQESVHPQQPMLMSTVQTPAAIKVINKQPLFSLLITGEKHNQFLLSVELSSHWLYHKFKVLIPHRAVAKMHWNIFSFSHLSGQIAFLLIQVLLKHHILNMPELVKHTRVGGSCDVHVDVLQWHSHLAVLWFKLCPVPGGLNGWGCGLFRCAQHMPLLVQVCFCYKPGFGNLWLCEEAEFLICSQHSGHSVENESCVCEKPANQASNGSQMRLPCSFTAVSPMAALCWQHGELCFISVTTKKQKITEPGGRTC